MQKYLQRSARWQLHCCKHRFSEGVVLYLPVFPLANEKPARTMKQMWDYEICVLTHPSTSGAACSACCAHTDGWRQCAREHVCIMHLPFWAPNTSSSPSGFYSQLDVVSTPEPPQPWLYWASTLASASSKMDVPYSVTSILRVGSSIWGPSIIGLNVRIWILKGAYSLIFCLMCTAQFMTPTL
jgi:hypothetical protein